MGKSRKKKKSTMNTASNTSQSSGYSIEENFSAEELKQITLIANAIVKAEEIRKQKEEEDRKVYVDELYNSAGYKKRKNVITQSINLLRVLIIMPFIYIKMLLFENSKDSLKKGTVSIEVLKSLISLVFVGVAILLFAVFLYSFNNFFQNTDNVTLLYSGILALVLSFISLVIMFETLNIDDRNYIFSMFSSVVSIITVIIAILTFVRGS